MRVYGNAHAHKSFEMKRFRRRIVVSYAGQNATPQRITLMKNARGRTWKKHRNGKSRRRGHRIEKALGRDFTACNRAARAEFVHYR